MKYRTIFTILCLFPAACTKEQAALKACESELKDKLVAPSTLKITGDKRVEVRPATEHDVEQSPKYAAERKYLSDPAKYGFSLVNGKLVGSEYDTIVNAMVDQYKRNLERAKSQTLTMADVRFEYESMNRMGVPLRGYAHCQLFAAQEDFDRYMKNGFMTLLD